MLDRMRLFVAAWLPPDLAASLAGPPPGPGPERRARTGLAWVAADRLHVTLHFVGEGDAGEVATGFAGLDPEAHVGTVARVGSVTEAFGPSVLVVEVGGLDRLAAAVRTALAGVGATDTTGPGLPPFRGHVTVARAPRGGDVRAWAGRDVGGAGTGWAVDEVALVASEQVAGERRYRVVSALALPPAAG